MPEYLARELIDMNIAKWSGTLESYKEDGLRSTPGLYEAAFCKHNQLIAAKQVLEGEFSCYPVFSKNKEVQKEKMIDAAKILVTEKPLTVDEKVSALASLSKKPKAGQVVYWPNVDGVNIPHGTLLGFWRAFVTTGSDLNAAVQPVGRTVRAGL